MKILIRLFFVVLGVWVMFSLAACSGASYGVSSYHGSRWDYGRYDYYDDRRDRYVDNRNRVARHKYYHQRTNPGRTRSMGHSRPGRTRSMGHSRRR